MNQSPSQEKEKYLFWASCSSKVKVFHFRAKVICTVLMSFHPECISQTIAKAKERRAIVLLYLYLDGGNSMKILLRKLSNSHPGYVYSSGAKGSKDRCRRTWSPWKSKQRACWNYTREGKEPRKNLSGSCPASLYPALETSPWALTQTPLPERLWNFGCSSNISFLSFFIFGMGKIMVNSQDVIRINSFIHANYIDRHNFSSTHKSHKT